MTDEIRERDPGHIHERAPVIVNDESTNPIAQIIYVLTAAVIALLSMRVLLSALGANPGNSFADFIYTLSHPFVAPFFGLFNYEFERGVNRFEIETVVAILVYAFLGWGLTNLVTMGGHHRHHYQNR